MFTKSRQSLNIILISSSSSRVRTSKEKVDLLLERPASGPHDPEQEEVRLEPPGPPSAAPQESPPATQSVMEKRPTQKEEEGKKKEGEEDFVSFGSSRGLRQVILCLAVFRKLRRAGFSHRGDGRRTKIHRTEANVAVACSPSPPKCPSDGDEACELT